ncbi:hypothetical protein [Streptomyces sp. NPDC017448]|uniref:hypothetical protein n=1 Tax=Streptomyces sp. NPDC017448 TaxID=3364996 RepID=UPI0037AC1AFD
MDALTGDDRHEDVRNADYEVHTEESFAAQNWCGDCILEYIECGMGRSLQYVTQLRPLDTPQHKQVLRELTALSITCRQP